MINDHNKVAADRTPPDCFEKEKKKVQMFYDEVGWKKVEGGLFVDTLLFEDLRPVSKDYRHKCHQRVKRHLMPRGKYILDVASGPIPLPEYLTYSSGYDFRICVDISRVALREAQRTLGDKGVYILADITNLPLKDSSVDAVVSLHTIYHVPADQQITAFREIFRVLKPRSSAVVVYSWGTRPFLVKLPFRMLQVIITGVQTAKSLIARPFREESASDRKICDPPRPDLSNLYFYTHNYEWFNKEIRRSCDFELMVWSSVNTPFLQMCIHSWCFGKQVLGLIYWFEERFPYWSGRLGQYPMLVFRK